MSLSWLAALDRQLFIWLNGWHHPWLDPVMEALSDRIWLIPLLLIAAGFVLWRGSNRRRWALLLLLVTLTASDQIASSVLKPAFERSRPCNEIGAVHYLDGDRGWVTTPAEITRVWKRSWSFPSSHAANGMAVALWLVSLFRRGRRWWLALAMGVGYSRIYLGVHYPGDVLGGLLLGWLLGWLAIRLYERFGPTEKSPESQATTRA